MIALKKYACARIAGARRSCSAHTHCTMNVVKKVANSVRRPAIFRAGSSGSTALLVDSEREPFQYEIQQQVLHCLMSGTQSTAEEKTQAIAKIGHMCWTGGRKASEFAAKNYLTLLTGVLSSRDALQGLRLQVVKSLSEICGASRLTQDLAREHSVLELVIDFMTEADSDEQVRWSLHTLFYLLCNNEASQQNISSNAGFEAGLERGLEVDWDGWEHNEARELIHLCRLNHLL